MMNTTPSINTILPIFIYPFHSSDVPKAGPYMLDYVKTILISAMPYIIPCVTVVLTFLFGQRQAYGNRKYQAQKQRYESFYVPYIQKLYAGHLFSDMKYTDLDLEQRSIFMDLLFQNLQYLDIHTQKLLPEFYDSTLHFFESESSDEPDSEAAAQLDRIFYEITSCILRESEALSKALNLPPIGAAFSQIYCSPKSDTKASSKRN